MKAFIHAGEKEYILTPVATAEVLTCGMSIIFERTFVLYESKVNLKLLSFQCSYHLMIYLSLDMTNMANVHIVPICIFAGALSMLLVRGCDPDIRMYQEILSQEQYFPVHSRGSMECI